MRNWSEQQLALLRALYPTTTAAELAPLLGRTPSAIGQMAAALKLEKLVYLPRSKPIGSERMDRGHLIRKVTDTRQPKKDWKRVDVIEWEALNGPVPPGMSLVVRESGLSRAPENLMLVPKQLRLAKYRKRKDQPLGAESMRDGLPHRKVAEAKNPRERWKRIDQIEWEAIHGPVPPGKHLMLIDPARPRTLDNLGLFTPEEHMRRVSVNNFPPEVLELYQLKAQINKRVKQMERAAESEKSEAT